MFWEKIGNSVSDRRFRPRFRDRGKSVPLHVALCQSIRSWCHWSLDQSLMVDPFSYLSFHPVLHNWYNKHIKDDLLLIEKSSPCSGGSVFLFCCLSGPLP